LTSQCNRIREHLKKIHAEGVSRVSEEASEDMDEIAATQVFKRNHLANNWEVSLFEFAVNPKSFGQTVENLFYISFLVKDGFVALSTDNDGLPTLRPSEPKTVSEQHERGAARHQAIFSLDYVTWKKLTKAFDIRTSLIAHRNDEQTTMNAQGWYG